MKIKQGDRLDLENLNMPGAEGVCAEFETFSVHDVIEGQIYTDNINIVCPPDEEIEEIEPGIFRFTKPESVRYWTW